MKKFLVILMGSACAFSVSLNAGQAKKRDLTDEQKALYQQMLEKYDANKDGRIDKEERSKFSKTDRKKFREAGLGHKKKGQKKSESNGQPEVKPESNSQPEAK